MNNWFELAICSSMREEQEEKEKKEKDRLIRMEKLGERLHWLGVDEIVTDYPFTAQGITFALSPAGNIILLGTCQKCGHHVASEDIKSLADLGWLIRKNVWQHSHDCVVRKEELIAEKILNMLLEELQKRMI